MLNITCELVQVRYNTKSDGSHLCWRLILDGAEHLANYIAVEAPCCTTKDWIEDQKVFKHHITIHNCRVIIDEDNNAKITPV
jgi:hypothetical protein